MRNGLLLLGYFALFFTVVIFRETFTDVDIAVMGVSGGLLLLGLALWVYIAQGYRTDKPGSPQD